MRVPASATCESPLRSFGGGPVKQAPFRVGSEAVGSLGDYIRRRKVDSIVPPSDHVTEREKGAALIAEHPVPAGFLAYCFEQGFDDESLKEHLVKVASISPGVAADFDSFFTKAAIGFGSLGTAWNNFKNWASPPITAPRVNPGSASPKPAPAGVPASLAAKMDYATGARRQASSSQLGGVAARGVNTMTGLAYGVGGAPLAGGAWLGEQAAKLNKAMGGPVSGEFLQPEAWTDLRKRLWNGAYAGGQDVVKNLDPRQDIQWSSPTAVGKFNDVLDRDNRATGGAGPHIADVARGGQFATSAAMSALPLVAALPGLAGVSIPGRAIASAVGTGTLVVPSVANGFGNARVQSAQADAYRQLATTEQMRQQAIAQIQSQQVPTQPQQPAGQGTVLRDGTSAQPAQQAGMQLPPKADAAALQQMTPEQAQAYHQYGEQQTQDLLKQWDAASPAQQKAMAPQMAPKIEEAMRAKILATCHATGQDPAVLYQKAMEGGWTVDDLKTAFDNNPGLQQQASAFGDIGKFWNGLSGGQQFALVAGVGTALAGLASTIFGEGGFMGLLMAVLGIGGAAAGAGMFGSSGPMAPQEQAGPPPEAMNQQAQEMDFFNGLPADKQRQAYSLMAPDKQQALDQGAKDWSGWQSGPWGSIGGMADAVGYGPNAGLAAKARELGVPPETLRRALEARIAMGGLG